MNILGISCLYHDSAACLLKDGRIVAAAQEERFTRIKHDTGFPTNSIKYCLEEGGIGIEDVDYIGFYEKPILKFERILHQHLQMFPRSFWTFFKAMPLWLNQKLRIKSLIRKELGYEGEVFFIEHHLAHASSAYLVSPFRKAAILTIDGVGEWSTATYGLGEGKRITLMKEIRFPHSLGLLYSAVTSHLGFKVNNDEYKIMGLAPYGEPRYLDKLKEIVDVKEDGSIRLNMDYFVYHYKLRMPSKKFAKLLGPARKKGEELGQKHKDIAASVQNLTEEVMIKMLNHICKETGCKNLCMAGGVALNSVANGKILGNTPFQKVYIQPASSDAGGCVGAAMYVYNSLLGNERNYEMNDIYLGPGFSREYTENFLKSSNIKYREMKENELIRKTAELLKENKIIGWFQGRMEWGPRALGNRSILANPCNPGMKDILNRRVKHREPFRPFAPVVPLEDAKDYFDLLCPVPFMLFVYSVREDKRKVIPAVTHVDGSGRLQTVTREQNPRYHKVIKEFEKLTGVPVLLNTSFNIKGEPIVCSPEDAYRCMAGTGIDYLVMDNFLISKKDNMKDSWDSTKKKWNLPDENSYFY